MSLKFEVKVRSKNASKTWIDIVFKNWTRKGGRDFTVKNPCLYCSEAIGHQQADVTQVSQGMCSLKE